MRLLHLLELSVVFFLCISQSCAQNSGTGRIFIGVLGNGTGFTNTTDYIFSAHQNANPLELPFYALVFNAAGDVVPRTDRVLVTCQSFPSGQTGYTNITLGSATLLPGGVDGGVIRISFGPGDSGRAVLVRCQGQTVGAVANCSAPAAQRPQFCPDTSISDPVSVTVKPGPVVSFCSAQNDLSTQQGNFTVRLSEAVRRGTSVTVTCQVDDNFLTSACPPQDRMNLIIGPAVTVGEGQTTVQLEYSVTTFTSARQRCRAVGCSAQSSATVDGYFQYQTATSQDDFSVALFTYEQVVQATVVPEYFTVYKTSFQNVLVLDIEVVQNVAFQCQASVVANVAEARNRIQSPDCSFVNSSAISTIPTTTTTTTPAPTTTTTTTTPAPTTTDANATVDVNATTVQTTTTTTTLPTPPIDPSSPWIARDNSFNVEASLKHHVVRTERLLAPVAPVQEVVVTTCCSVTNSSRYKDLTVVAVAVANLEPFVCLNCSGGVTSGVSTAERFIINPAYVEVAPCPCDLTFKACDVECCCDGDCTDNEKQTFTSCIPGLFGGQGRGTDLRNCKSTHFPKDDWFPLMCVQFETNALLGHFYFNTAKLETTTVSGRLAEILYKTYTYRETESRYRDLLTVDGYQDGSKILTINGEGTRASYGLFSLPQNSPTGPCIDTAPVRFLRDSAATCNRMLTASTCADFTPFSARMYLEASSLFNPACPRSFAVSPRGANTIDKASAEVNYYCAGRNTADYIKSRVRYSDFWSPQSRYLFSSGLQAENCTDVCENQICYSYNTGRGNTDTRPLPSRCHFDSSFGLPPIPSYNSITGVCSNAVLEVRYRVSWSGNEVSGVSADVIMGDVVVPSGSSVDVSQHFNASFVHSYPGSSNQTDNYQNLTTPYERSGRPGYDFGKPLATGCGSLNETDGTFLVDESEEKQMAVFSPGVDGLCLNSSRRFLTFGDDVTSSCMLRLSLQEFQDCDSLRQLLLNHLNILMPSNVIGRFGYNDPESQNMWLSILREEPYGTPAETPTTTTTVLPTTTTTPATNVTTATPVSTTAESADVNSTAGLTFDAIRGGVCRNITSGIHLQILYAETGRNNRYPLREIIGASVRYSLSNWSMSCVGPYSARCLIDSSQPQTFLLTSSVGFTRVPATTPEKPILFYKVHSKDTCDSDTCYRFFDDFDRSVCHYDTCWYELFYPLTDAYQGYDSILYTRAFSLVTVVFAVGYLVITKPWK